jgi:hypothetical protein
MDSAPNVNAPLTTTELAHRRETRIVAHRRVVTIDRSTSNPIVRLSVAAALIVVLSAMADKMGVVTAEQARDSMKQRLPDE